MTYLELAEEIQKMDSVQQNSDITVHDGIDDNHPIICFSS